ncbi:MAG: hypothetical protein GX321_00745 [Clostridiales bacterium]|nr:hypothetical protein [Clostridiales bacterium]
MIDSESPEISTDVISTTPTIGPAVLKIVAGETISTGGHSMVIDSDGSLWGWGGNSYGENVLIVKVFVERKSISFKKKGLTYYVSPILFL